MLDRRAVRVLIVSALFASVAALLALSGWVLWPEWQSYRERAEFERLARQLHPGIVPLEDLYRLIPHGHSAVQFITYRDASRADHHVAFAPYYLRSYWYFVYIEYDPPGAVTQSVKVYRLDVPAKTYQPQTKWGVARTGKEPPELGSYMADFFYFVSGQAGSDVEFRCDLIYSDPDD